MSKRNVKKQSKKKKASTVASPQSPAKPKKAVKPLTESTENSRELLLRAARHCFATMGFDRTSTRDIAKSAGVNISLISYHFNGKDGLYRSCLEELSSDGLATVERVLNKPTSIDDFKTRFSIFIEEFIRLHLRNRENSCIMLREISDGTITPIAAELIKNKFSPVFDKLVDFINYAQKQKFVVSTIDAELIAATLMGTITNMIRTETLRISILNKPGFLEDKVINKTMSQLAQLFWNGINSTQAD